MSKKITWEELESKISVGAAARKGFKLETTMCPVCDNPRSKGNHSKCSKITQLKYMRERGEI